MNTLGRLITSLLFCLSLFQLAEYFVCGKLGISGSEWSKIGYSAITLLPPLGLHILSNISRRSNRVLLGSAYLISAIFIAFILFSQNVLNGSECTANYAIFHLDRIPQILYSTYYFGMLLGTVILSQKWQNNSSISKKRKTALAWMSIGYAVFTVPVLLINLLNPDSRAGIPSIMCGFAIFFALILSTKISPAMLVGRKNVPKVPAHNPVNKPHKEQ